MSSWFQAHQESLLASARQAAFSDGPRQKQYLALNLKPRAHRTALLLHLLDRGLIDRGMVSYLGDDLGEIGADSLEAPTEALSFIQKLPSAPRLLSRLQELRARTPIVIDRDVKLLNRDLHQRTTGAIEFMIPEIKLSGNPAPAPSTYFEIVTCTWLTTFSHLLMGEKNLRPLLRFQPFVNIGSPRLLEYMRSIGFETFSPWVDESYDMVEDPVQRLEVTLKEIDRLCAFSDREWASMYREMWPKLEHNYRHLVQAVPTVFAHEAEKNVLSHLQTSSIKRVPLWERVSSFLEI